MDPSWLKNSFWTKTITLNVVCAKYMLNGRPNLDVRTKEEFETGHLENAVNIPYMFITRKGWVKNPKFVDTVSAVFSKEDHLVVGCQDGARSEYACNDLRDANFGRVYNLGGGYSSWVANGLPITEPQPQAPKLGFIARIRQLF